MICDGLTDILSNKIIHEAAQNFRNSWNNYDIRYDYLMSFSAYSTLYNNEGEMEYVCRKTDEQIIDYFFEPSKQKWQWANSETSPIFFVLYLIEKYKNLKWEYLVDLYYEANKNRIVQESNVLYAIYVFRFMKFVTWENPYQLIPFGKRAYNFLLNYYEY